VRRGLDLVQQVDRLRHLACLAARLDQDGLEVARVGDRQARRGGFQAAVDVQDVGRENRADRGLQVGIRYRHGRDLP
jgi:hypothetical protein